MIPKEFFIDGADYGLPTRDELVAHRIWDSHFHGFYVAPGQDPIAQYERNRFYVERMGIERSISFEIGGTLDKPISRSPYEDKILAILERDRAFLSGITPIDPGFPDESCAKMEKLLRKGPCIGIKYVGGKSTPTTCEHPNSDPIIRFAASLNATIYIHTWLNVGGSPNLPGGGNVSGENTPMQVAKLARRFPDVRMICGHSGGDWELGVRAIKSCPNVLFEFSGSDPHSGMVEYAVRELGVDRLVWGGHGPSRSYATELGKILDADISRADRMKILGGNYRKYAAPIFKAKGIAIDV